MLLATVDCLAAHLAAIAQAHCPTR
jgi:hypothetical protein